MKKLIFVLLLGVGLACQGDRVNVLSPQAFKEKMEASPAALLIDVRTAGEISATGMIEGAEHVVYGDGFEAAIETIQQNKIFVYCASGIRSGKAAGLLRNKGFEVYELSGGINAWIDQKFPVVQ